MLLDTRRDLTRLKLVHTADHSITVTQSLESRLKLIACGLSILTIATL